MEREANERKEVRPMRWADREAECPAAGQPEKDGGEQDVVATQVCTVLPDHAAKTQRPNTAQHSHHPNP